MKVTVAFSDDELYHHVRIRAAETNRPIRDIVEEALRAWLEAQENADDAAASQEALAEYGAVGGVDADSYFERLVAEGRVTYETD